MLARQDGMQTDTVFGHCFGIKHLFLIIYFFIHINTDATPVLINGAYFD